MSEDKQEYDPAKKWVWKYESLSDEKIKELAKDMYNNIIFSNFFILESDKHLIHSIFMPLGLFGPGMGSEDGRENSIDSILEEEHYNEYISNIGMLYEYMEKASPRGVNGYPMFPSMKFIDKSDTKKVIEYYNKYSKLRKKIEEDL